jgi:hypothetical protein
MAINSSQLDYLLLAYHHSRDELARSGLPEVVAIAERWRDELVARAVDALKPLGIPDGEIRGLVETHLRMRHAAKDVETLVTGGAGSVRHRDRQEELPIDRPGELDLR